MTTKPKPRLLATLPDDVGYKYASALNKHAKTYHHLSWEEFRAACLNDEPMTLSLNCYMPHRTKSGRFTSSPHTLSFAPTGELTPNDHDHADSEGHIFLASLGNKAPECVMACHVITHNIMAPRTSVISAQGTNGSLRTLVAMIDNIRRNNGAFKPVAKLTVEGITPDMLDRFVDAGFPHDKACHFLVNRVPLNTAKAWLAANRITLADARLAAKGMDPDNANRDENRTGLKATDLERWRKHGFDEHTAMKWQPYKFTPYLLKRARRLKVDEDAIMNRLVNGFPTNTATDWETETTLDEAIKYKWRNVHPGRAKEFLACEVAVDPEEAQHVAKTFGNASVCPELMITMARAGLTQADYRHFFQHLYSVAPEGLHFRYVWDFFHLNFRSGLRHPIIAAVHRAAGPNASKTDRAIAVTNFMITNRDD